jgi:quercetin dioxygenase-like cupin family protein
MTAARYSLETVPVREIVPGFHGRFIHGDGMTFAWWQIDVGAAIPEHAHPHEQVVNVLEGALELTVDGVVQTFGPGDVVAIPGGVRHAARGLSACRVLDVFAPVREDYR